MVRKVCTAVLATALMSWCLGSVTQASAKEFHCAAEACRFTMLPDGTGKTAHHVIIIDNAVGESVSVTCSRLTGESVFSYNKTTSSILFGSLAYDECLVNGSSGVSVNMNGCLYEITALGRIELWACNAGKQMEIVLSTGCVYKIPEQDFAAGSYAFHTIGTSPNQEITMEAFLGGIRNMVVTATGTKAQCLMDISHGPLNGTYTTGNTIFRAELWSGVFIPSWYE